MSSTNLNALLSEFYKAVGFPDFVEQEDHYKKPLGAFRSLPFKGGFPGGPDFNSVSWLNQIPEINAQLLLE